MNRALKGSLLALSLTLVALLLAIAKAPNFEMSWSRTLQTKSTPSQMNRLVQNLEFWPYWFHHLESARKISPSTQTFIKQNDRVLLQMKKKFELKALIVSYIPNEKLILKIEEDSSGKLFRAFEFLVWTIEWREDPQGSWIYGQVETKTAHWRSRISGRLAQNILLFQSFYPNLQYLSQLTFPLSIENLLPPPKSSL